MKFRARTSNDQMLQIHGVIHQLERNALGDKVAVYLTSDFVRLAVVNSVEVDNSRCFAELSVDALFNEYIIESKSDNAILFEIGLSNWCKALQSGDLTWNY
jgi:Hus1-like protein